MCAWILISMSLTNIESVLGALASIIMFGPWGNSCKFSQRKKHMSALISFSWTKQSEKKISNLNSGDWLKGTPRTNVCLIEKCFNEKNKKFAKKATTSLWNKNKTENVFLLVSACHPVDPNCLSNLAFVGHSFNSHVYKEKANENTNHDNPSHAHSYDWRTLENKFHHRSFYSLFPFVFGCGLCLSLTSRRTFGLMC